MITIQEYVIEDPSQFKIDQILADLKQPEALTLKAEYGQRILMLRKDFIEKFHEADQVKVGNENLHNRWGFNTRVTLRANSAQLELDLDQREKETYSAYELYRCRCVGSGTSAETTLTLREELTSARNFQPRRWLKAETL